MSLLSPTTVAGQARLVLYIIVGLALMVFCMIAGSFSIHKYLFVPLYAYVEKETTERSFTAISPSALTFFFACFYIFLPFVVPAFLLAQQNIEQWADRPLRDEGDDPVNYQAPLEQNNERKAYRSSLTEIDGSLRYPSPLEQDIERKAAHPSLVERDESLNHPASLDDPITAITPLISIGVAAHLALYMAQKLCVLIFSLLGQVLSNRTALPLAICISAILPLLLVPLADRPTSVLLGLRNRAQENFFSSAIFGSNAGLLAYLTVLTGAYLLYCAAISIHIGIHVLVATQAAALASPALILLLLVASEAMALASWLVREPRQLLHPRTLSAPLLAALSADRPEFRLALLATITLAGTLASAIFFQYTTCATATFLTNHLWRPVALVAAVYQALAMTVCFWIVARWTGWRSGRDERDAASGGFRSKDSVECGRAAVKGVDWVWWVERALYLMGSGAFMLGHILWGITCPVCQPPERIA